MTAFTIGILMAAVLVLAHELRLEKQANRQISFQSTRLLESVIDAWDNVKDQLEENGVRVHGPPVDYFESVRTLTLELRMRLS